MNAGINEQAQIEEADGIVAAKLRLYLENSGIDYRDVQHAPTLTSEQSAQARGEPIEIGGKALLLKLDTRYALFVLSAACKLDNAAVRNALGVNKLRFASREELVQLTGLLPGSVPPFGEPILPFELYADDSVFQQSRIAFNAGLLTYSMIMSVADWAQLARPKRLAFAQSG